MFHRADIQVPADMGLTLHTISYKHVALMNYTNNNNKSEGEKGLTSDKPSVAAVPETTTAHKGPPNMSTLDSRKGFSIIWQQAYSKSNNRL